jgi:D-xylulose kinase
MSQLFAGLDVSTQGCKLVVIDLAAKDVVYVDTVSYDDDLPQFGTRDGVIQGLPAGVSESDPGMWLAAVDLVFDRLLASALPVEAIRCISVSGQQHGLVALDREGQLARPTSKLWNDHSTAEECEILTERVGGLEAMIEAIGNSQRPGYTAGKILHLRRHEPETYNRASTLFLVHNYINWYLTGGVEVMEPGDTSGMALWHPATGQWSRKVIEAIDPDLTDKLPEVRPADRSIGKIAREHVERIGFSPDCKVDAGSGDNMYGALGTGNVTEGLVTVSLGTSGTACTFLEEPFVDPLGEVASYCDSTGHYLPLLCVSNLANGYNEMRRVHGLSHDDFDRAATAVPPAEEGRLLIPWFGGERTPDLPQARPVLFGFSLESLSPEKLCRAVLDGHVLNLHAGFSRLPVDVKEIRVTGGLSRSGVWCQTIADVFAAEVVPVEGEGAALGAALHAAWVWLEEEGRDAPLAELIEPFIILDQKGRKRPLAENRAAYSYLRQQYRALSRRLRGLEAEDPFALRPEDAFY